MDSLSEALAKAEEKGPWILASAGIGSIYSRVFSSRHGDAGDISPLGLDRLPAAVFRGRTSRDRVYGRSAWQGGKYILAKLRENLVAGSFTRRDVQSSRGIQDKDTPLVVISSGKHVKSSGRWEHKQRDLTKLTDRLKSWDIVDGAPHEVWRTFEGREKIEQRLKQLVRV
ncbi:mitochondrial integral membrane protein [Dactylonectria estremocensis]|uniref:Mitochondrial integral membrane protein n=1 Tax=Dactylonectria estremocensis TaxID=1079267 RepID=A0A9P9DBC4_9HYPO|nr:mitochondrial integral membrane protein [Dactylonectria estremocensis]